MSAGDPDHQQMLCFHLVRKSKCHPLLRFILVRSDVLNEFWISVTARYHTSSNQQSLVFLDSHQEPPQLMVVRDSWVAVGYSENLTPICVSTPVSTEHPT